MINIWEYIIFGGITVVLTVIFTIRVAVLARKYRIMDYPGQARKIHKKAVPLLGGVAIFLAFFLVIFYNQDKILAGELSPQHWLGVLVGGAFLMIGGWLDDKYNLSPKYQIIWPLLAIFSVILGGVGIEKITNPWGGFFYLGFISHILIFFWLMGMMYTTKLLDGLDGLVTGVVGIGAFIVFLFTMTTQYFQPDIGWAAFILFCACLGFLIFNWHPAKIFLGEGGSLFLGYILGVLAIISGGKIAIALLVMGIPVLDVLWTILRRMLKGKNPFKYSDRQHLHFRLLDLGLSQWQAVLVFYGFALFFGLGGLFLQSQGKILALGVLVLVMLMIIIILTSLEKKKRRPKLLLHICCASCGAYVSQVLQGDYRITLYYDNPNMYPEDEFEKRWENVIKVGKHFNIPTLKAPYDHQAWLTMAKGLESESERGKRCLLCYHDRLQRTAKMAKEKRVKYFATTLSISPHKSVEAINNIGNKLAHDYGLSFLNNDFKKKDGFRRSVNLSQELGLYRQDYCGCEFSIKK